MDVFPGDCWFAPHHVAGKRLLDGNALRRIDVIVEPSDTAIRGNPRFRGDPRTADNSTVLAKLQEDLESKKYLIDNYFDKEINFVIDYRSSRGHVGGISATTKTHRYTIDLENAVQKAGPEGQVLHVGSIRYCQVKSNWADFLPRASNLNAVQSMSYEFVYGLNFVQIHLT